MADHMVRRALAAKGDITYMQRDMPEDTPSNQLEEVYAQQGARP